jgi:general secretion pathway protein G
MQRVRAFTMIELLVTLAILSLLAAAAFPLAEMSSRRAKEKELREALWEIRHAIDAYKKAGDEGRIRVSADQSGYPANLRALVEGVVSAKNPAAPKYYFLRRIPRDPMASDPSVPAEQTWGKRSYDSPPDAPQEGKDVFDVFSIDTRIGLNGIPYSEW